MFIACPHCHSRAIIRTSRAMSPLTRDAYCQCTNLACGHTFRAVTEIVETISPSAVPDPEIVEKLSPAKRPHPPPKQLPALPAMT
ncbi:MAG: ogr/Delta-like zinc finger family protein [Gammaproteobacteria bacterium]|nr:ogr/Delta-like zinc finger family protein [Gammaproteobacteria bacterium]